MKQIFDLWLSSIVDGMPTTSIRYFETIFYPYVGMEAPECTMMKECGPYVVVEYNGNMYSCDFFVEPEWKLGNIMNDQIINVLNSKRQQIFGATKAILPIECRQCSWLRNCYGGCPKDRIKDPADNGKPRFCTSNKMIFEHVHPTMKHMAKLWKQQ